MQLVLRRVNTINWVAQKIRHEGSKSVYTTKNWGLNLNSSGRFTLSRVILHVQCIECWTCRWTRWVCTVMEASQSFHWLSSSALSLQPFTFRWQPSTTSQRNAEPSTHRPHRQKHPPPLLWTPETISNGGYLRFMVLLLIFRCFPEASVSFMFSRECSGSHICKERNWRLMTNGWD